MTPRVTATADRAAMTAPRRDINNPWPLHINLDLAGMMPCRVVPMRQLEDRTPHLQVVTGPLLTVCLDAQAVSSLARAWARAHRFGRGVLPMEAAWPPQAPNVPEPDARGYTAPLANAVTEGPGRWIVTQPEVGRPFVSLSSHWATIRVHDQAALIANQRVWAHAQNLAHELMRAPQTYRQLSDDLRLIPDEEQRERAAERRNQDRPQDRERGRQPGSGRGQGRGR